MSAEVSTRRIYRESLTAPDKPDFLFIAIASSSVGFALGTVGVFIHAFLLG